MKCNNSGVSVSSHWWSAKSYGTDAMSDSSQRAQNLREAPLTGKLLLFQRKQLQRIMFHARAQIQLCGKHVAPHSLNVLQVSKPNIILHEGNLDLALLKRKVSGTVTSVR